MSSLSLYDLNNNKATKDVATTISDGLMSAADKTKLENLKTVATTGSYNDLIDKPVSLPADGGNADKLDGLEATEFATAAQGTKADNALPASSYTASDVLTKIKTVDGAGSGLDADTVDGIHANDFIQKTDKITLPANTTVRAYFNIPNSNVAPISPINGDIWQQNNDLWARLNGSTRKIYHDGNAPTANLSTVTQAVAEAGTNPSNYAWTPQRVHQAVDANLIKSSKLFAQASGIKGTGTGASNLSYFNFFESNGTTRQGYIGYGDSAGTLFIWNELNTDVVIRTSGAGKAKVNGNEIWHAGNDGSSSGLDADLLDGQHASYYATAASVSAITTVRTATITTNWNGTTAPYTQTITVSGVTANDKPVISPVYDANNATAILQKTAWNMVGKIVTGNNSITVTCFEEKPTTAIPIQIKGV